ncbi:hypothetical protein JEQ12_017090 [Ovis aries]|uniref:Uncharacterized protein n=1 Tax=Ovis aries TaxID=9940 RepID=A0A836A6M2_SHEEP|nr:hypothetical protein JEQ12_017090 [Ovis aries]
MLSFLSRWPYAWCVMTNIIGNKQLEDKAFLRISGEPQIWLGTQQVDMTAAAIYGYKKQQSQGAGVMRKRLSDTGLQLTHKIKEIRLGNLKKMTMDNFSKSMKYTRAAGEGADVIQEEDSRADTRID